MQIFPGKINRAAKNLPIKFEVADCLIHNDIVKFMGTKKRIVTVNRHIDANFVNDGATDVLTRNEGEANLQARVYVVLRLWDITYISIQSAIYFLYCQSAIERQV